MLCICIMLSASCCLQAKNIAFFLLRVFAKRGTFSSGRCDCVPKLGELFAGLRAGVFRIIAGRINLWRSESEAQGLLWAVHNIIDLKHECPVSLRKPLQKHSLLQIHVEKSRLHCDSRCTAGVEVNAACAMSLPCSEELCRLWEDQMDSSTRAEVTG